jgi:predicted PurR-regulated permease PerM
MRRNPKPDLDTSPSDRKPLPLGANARTVARAVLTIALVALALWIAADFLAPLGWAAILSITAWPLYVRFAHAFSWDRSQLLAPLLFTLLVGAILFVPVALVTHQIAQQGDAGVAWITQARENGIAVPGWVAQFPIFAEALDHWWRENLTDPKVVAGWFQNASAETVAEWARALGGQLLHRVLMFLVSLMALFVLLRNGVWVAGRTLDTADRIFGDPRERLASKLIEAIRGSVNGTVVVAVAEGLLIGAAYVMAAVPNQRSLLQPTTASPIVP